MKDYAKMVQHAVKKTEERYYKTNQCIHDLIESAIILGCTDAVAISISDFLGYLDENVDKRPKSTWANVLNQACSDNCKHYGVVFEKKADGYIAFQPLVWEEMLKVGWTNGCAKALRRLEKVQYDNSIAHDIIQRAIEIGCSDVNYIYVKDMLVGDIKKTNIASMKTESGNSYGRYFEGKGRGVNAMLRFMPEVWKRIQSLKWTK